MPQGEKNCLRKKKMEENGSRCKANEDLFNSSLLCFLYFGSSNSVTIKFIFKYFLSFDEI